MKRTRRLFTAVILAAILFVTCFFSGCSCIFGRLDIADLPDIRVGETLDLTDYVSTSGNFVVASGDESVVAVVSDTEVMGVSPGSTYIKIKADGVLMIATADINVRSAELTSASISSSGSLYQYLDEISPVKFTAVPNEGAIFASHNWTINGVGYKAENDGSLTFTPPSKAGKYVVEFYDGKVSAKTELFVYNEFFVEPSAEIVGDTVLDVGDSITLNVSWTDSLDNPPSKAEVFVNGERVNVEHCSSDSTSYTLAQDKAGFYEIEVKINERIVKIDGNDSVILQYRGISAPYGLTVDYDSAYPSVFLRWENKEPVDFEIEVASDGKVFNTEVPASTGCLDIGEHIDLNRGATIKVRSLGDGIIGGDSIYLPAEDYIVLIQEPLSASEIVYLGKKYLDANYYMSDDEEVYDLFQYMLYFRPDAKETYYSGASCEHSRQTVYFGYTSTSTASDFKYEFGNRLSQTGSYIINVEGKPAKGSTMTINLYFYSGGVPTAKPTQPKAESLVTPHFSDTGYKGELPIESAPKSASVAETSDELYYTLQEGCNPNIADNSAAERIYDKAYAVLTDIIDEDMSDAEIAHAVYDWVVLNVTYDDTVVGITQTSIAVRQPAFYLEGVFDYGIAVCDGISKAYTLLCNMAGVDCIRVVGTVASGNHAWNKVKMENGWYIVDATWGLGYINSSDGEKLKANAHDYLLITDAEADARKENGGVYPQTATQKYDWYGREGRVFTSGNIDQMSEKVAQQIADGLAAFGSKEITVGGETYKMKYYAQDYYVSAENDWQQIRIMNTLTGLTSPLGRALKKLGVSYKFLTKGNYIIIAAA